MLFAASECCLQLACSHFGGLRWVLAVPYISTRQQFCWYLVCVRYLHVVHVKRMFGASPTCQQ